MVQVIYPGNSLIENTKGGRGLVCMVIPLYKEGDIYQAATIYPTVYIR